MLKHFDWDKSLLVLRDPLKNYYFFFVYLIYIVKLGTFKNLVKQNVLSNNTSTVWLTFPEECYSNVLIYLKYNYKCFKSDKSYLLLFKCIK